MTASRPLSLTLHGLGAREGWEPAEPERGVRAAAGVGAAGQQPVRGARPTSTACCATSPTGASTGTTSSTRSTGSSSRSTSWRCSAGSGRRQRAPLGDRPQVPAGGGDDPAARHPGQRRPHRSRDALRVLEPVRRRRRHREAGDPAQPGRGAPQGRAHRRHRRGAPGRRRHPRGRRAGGGAADGDERRSSCRRTAPSAAPRWRAPRARSTSAAPTPPPAPRSCGRRSSTSPAAARSTSTGSATRPRPCSPDRRLRDVGDVFSITGDTFEGLRGFGPKKVAKVLAGLEAARDRPLWRLLVGLSIRHVGPTAAQDVARHFRTLDAVGGGDAGGARGGRGRRARGGAGARRLVRRRRHRDIVERLRAGGARLADEGADTGPRPLEGVAVVVTGTLSSYSRDGAVEAVQERGGKVTGSVSRKTDFVVVGAEPGASKYDRAVALGLPLLDDAGFTVLLEQGPDAARARADRTAPGGASPIGSWRRRRSCRAGADGRRAAARTGGSSGTRDARLRGRDGPSGPCGGPGAPGPWPPRSAAGRSALLGPAPPRHRRPRRSAFVLVCGLLLLSELRPLFTAGSRDANGLVLSTTLVFALLLRYGLPAALLLQVLATVVGDLSKRKAAWKVVFNVGQYSLSWAAAAGALALFGSGGDLRHPTELHGRDLLAALFATVAYFVVNEVLVTHVLALRDGDSTWQVLREEVAYESLTTGALMALSPLVCLAMESGVVFLPLLLPPLVAVYAVGSVALDRERQSLTDALTGLPNRTLLAQRAQEALRRRPRRAGAHRPRPLQGGQRHAGPPRRRPAAAGRGAAAVRGRPRGRHGGAPRRRRVRARAAGVPGRRAGPGGDRAAVRGALRAHRARGAARRRRRERRHRRLARPRHRHRGAACSTPTSPCT